MRYTLIVLVSAYAGMFLLGFPIILVLRMTHNLTLARLGTFGGLSGLFTYPFSLFLVSEGAVGADGTNMALGFIMGAVVALTYSVIASYELNA
jgi:hypothetical protein